jgi:hypothetical protein
MPIFTDAQMQVFADLLEELGMVDTATVERPSLASGVTTLTLIGESPCLVQPPLRFRPSRDFEGWQGQDMPTWPVLFPLNSFVLEGDIITVKGQKMEAQVKKNPRSFAVYDEFECSGVRG